MVGHKVVGNENKVDIDRMVAEAEVDVRRTEADSKVNVSGQ